MFLKILTIVNFIFAVFVLYLIVGRFDEYSALNKQYISANAALSEELISIKKNLDESNERYDQLELRMMELEDRVSGIQAVGHVENRNEIFKVVRQGDSEAVGTRNNGVNDVKYTKKCSGFNKPPFVYLGLGLAGLVLQQCDN